MLGILFQHFQTASNLLSIHKKFILYTSYIVESWQLQQIEVFEPTITNRRTMGKYQYTIKRLTLDNFQGTQCLTKTHFGIPQHFGTMQKLSKSFCNSQLLFFSQYNLCFFLSCRCCFPILSLKK